MKSIIIVVMAGVAIIGVTSTMSGWDATPVVSKAVPMTEVYVGTTEGNDLLDYDFSPAVREIPPRYSGGGINPFTIIEPDKPQIMKVKVEKNKIHVPYTPLTRWVIPQLNLTGVVITSKSALAFFTGPDSGKAYIGRAGDYIGRAGIKIASITTGVVHLSNGSKLVVNQ